MEGWELHLVGGATRDDIAVQQAGQGAAAVVHRGGVRIGSAAAFGPAAAGGVDPDDHQIAIAGEFGE